MPRGAVTPIPDLRTRQERRYGFAVEGQRRRTVPPERWDRRLGAPGLPIKLYLFTASA